MQTKSMLKKQKNIPITQSFDVGLTVRALAGIDQ